MGNGEFLLGKGVFKGLQENRSTMQVDDPHSMLLSFIYFCFEIYECFFQHVVSALASLKEIIRIDETETATPKSRYKSFPEFLLLFKLYRYYQD